MVALNELSASQLAAVAAPWHRQMNVVLSTAGSGKTLVLTKRAVQIAKDLVDQGARNQRVLCVCFNHAMADEMHHRITQLLRTENLTSTVYVTRNAYTISSAVTVEVRTFHGLGRYILLSSTFLQRQLVYLPDGYLTVLQGMQLKKGLFLALKAAGLLQGFNNEKAARSTLSKLLAQFSELKGRHFDKSCELFMLHGQVEEQNVQVPEEFPIYEDFMYSKNATDYGDMIWKSVRLLWESPEVKERMMKRYSSILVDEFQDLSAAQLFMIKTLVEKTRSLTLVGDDDQQIYSWRTSNDWFIHKVVCTVFPDIKTLTLPENRRCPGSVVKVSRAVIEHNMDRAEKSIVPTRSDGLPVHIVGCQNLELEKQFLLESIERLLPTLERDGGRILVLFRINELLMNFKKHLSDAGVDTTRKIRADIVSKPVGSHTLVVFAIMSLMSKDIDLDAFVWAATTVSPDLQPSLMHEILSSEEGKVKKEEDETIPNDSSSLYPSAFLGQVTKWYAIRSNANDAESNSSLEPVYKLLSRADNLRMSIDSVNSLEEMIRCAEVALLSDNSAGASQESVIEDDPESHSSQRPEQGEGKTGYDVLTSVASKIDAKMKRKLKRQQAQKSTSRVKKQASVASNADDASSDLDDFSQLFSNDINQSARKKRKLQGISPNTSRASQAPILKREHLAECVRDFYKAALSKLESRAQHASAGTREQVDADEARTVLSTVHNAKGSTFEYVFLCGVNKYNFPNGAMQGDCGPYGQAFVEPSSINPVSSWCQEERRVFFVAQTRAVTQFVCTYSAEKTGSTRIKDYESMFISEVFKKNTGEQCMVESFVQSRQDIKAVVSRDLKQAIREKHRKGEGAPGGGKAEGAKVEAG